MAPRAFSNEMTKTRFGNLGARRNVGKAPNPETAFFLATLAIGLALLSILAVLALAAFVELAHILPFFPLSLVLLVASALFLRRWVAGEVEEGAVREVAHRLSERRPPKPARGPTDGLDRKREMFKSAVARR